MSNDQVIWPYYYTFIISHFLNLFTLSSSFTLVVSTLSQVLSNIEAHKSDYKYKDIVKLLIIVMT